MKKVLLHVTLLVAMLLTASAGWVPAPLDIPIPTDVAILSISSTGSVTSAAAPAAGTQRLALSWSAGSILPAAPTNTLTVTVICGSVTNEYAFTNGSPAQAAGCWINPSDTVSLSLSATVTNLPTATLAYIASPATVTRTLLPHERWRYWGARRCSAILPAATTNTIAVSASYAYGETSALATLTNGCPISTASSYLSLLPGDNITLTATQVTNSPTVRLHVERFYIIEPSDL